MMVAAMASKSQPNPAVIWPEAVREATRIPAIPASNPATDVGRNQCRRQVGAAQAKRLGVSAKGINITAESGESHQEQNHAKNYQGNQNRHLDAQRRSVRDERPKVHCAPRSTCPRWKPARRR